LGDDVRGDRRRRARDHGDLGRRLLPPAGEGHGRPEPERRRDDPRAGELLMRGLASAAGFALLATACTAIVAGELKKYDDYKVSDTFTPGSSSSGGKSDPCALTDPDAGNECSACIATSCVADIAYACQADGGHK